MLNYNYEASGGIVIDGEFSYEILGDYKFDIEWDIYVYFDVIYDFTWDVGELPLKVYQIEGHCKKNDGGFGDCEFLFPSSNSLSTSNKNDLINCKKEDVIFCGCEILSTNNSLIVRNNNSIASSNNNSFDCSQKFIQTIFARNLADVCDFLNTTNWKWPISSIKKFSTLASDLVAIGNIRPPECNILENVEFCHIPECLEFCLHTNGKTHMGMSCHVVENIYQHEAKGGIKISGEYDHIRYFYGSGDIYLSGESHCYSKPSFYSYLFSGIIQLSGEANFFSSYWYFYPSDGIILSGESNVKSSKWHYAGTGGIMISGYGNNFPKPVYISNGNSDVYPTYAGIRIDGFAEYPILARASGGIIIYGTSIADIINSNHIGVGGININGESNVISPDWHYDSFGGIELSGDIDYNFLSLAYNVDNSLPITFDGIALNRNSINGNFWYISLNDFSINLGGNSEYRISQLKYKPLFNPDIILGGRAGIISTYRFVDDINMGVGFYIDNFEINYSPDGQLAPFIVPPNQTVNTTCGQCNRVSLKLNFKHNLEFGSIFRDFLIRNGHTIPQSFPLFYNKRSNSWQSTIYYDGVSSDNFNDLESWRINVDWSCISKYADDNFSSSVWRFSLLFTRINKNTNLDFDTRLLILFPAEEICFTADRDGLDFSFKFDTNLKTISTKENVVVDVINLYDNIGLFKGSYWTKNKLNIRISENYIFENIDKKNITFIIPDKQKQFLI